MAETERPALTALTLGDFGEGDRRVLEMSTRCGELSDVLRAAPGLKQLAITGAFGVNVSLDEFDNRHRRHVTVPEACLHDP